MIDTPRVTAPPKILRLSSRNWAKGYMSELEEGRTPNDGLVGATNVQLYQNGTVGPRPSLVRYWTAPTGTILGQIYEFVKTTGATTENWIITLQNVAGVTNVYISKDGGSWTLCPGKTYDNSASARFVQVDNKVLVMNGVDNLSYLNIATSTVIPFVALTNPSAPTLAKTGLAGTSYTYYYKVAANNAVGTTSASSATSITVGKIRDAWISGTDKVAVSWSSVASATSYNVYIGTQTGEEVYITTVNGTTFDDDGTIATDVTRVAPIGNSTAGMKASRGEVINGQVFLTGDSDNPRYVWFGGSGTSVLDFSSYGGGGWVEIGKGTKEVPVRVMSFRNGRGEPAITVLCRGTNGTGKRYILSPNSVTVGDTIINYFSITEDNGQDGTDSPDSVVSYQDALWYISKDGFKTTHTKQQVQNILSTEGVSDKIRPDITSLNSLYMSKCVGLAYQSRLYWSLPVGSTSNNQIWVLDLDPKRGGAWVLPWNISADWMTLYNDNSGSTHFLVLSGNVIYELSYAAATIDDNTPFPTNVQSGIIKFSDDGLEWAKVIDVTFVFLRPTGTINVSISGKTLDNGATTVGVNSFVTSASIAGWGEDGWGDFGWSDQDEVPTRYGQALEQYTVEPEDEDELNWITWSISTIEANTSYQLSDVIIRYVPIGTLSLS